MLGPSCDSQESLIFPKLFKNTGEKCLERWGRDGGGEQAAQSTMVLSGLGPGQWEARARGRTQVVLVAWLFPGFRKLLNPLAPTDVTNSLLIQLQMGSKQSQVPVA